MPIASGLPPVKEIGDPLRYGGKLDTLTRKYVGPCDHWLVWFVGERQRNVIDRFLAEDGARNILLYSAEGAGKTTLQSMLGWLAVFRATAEGVPGALGATAPTHARLGTLQKAICGLGPVNSSRDSRPSSWGTFYVGRWRSHCRKWSRHPAQIYQGSKRSGWIADSRLELGLGALMDEGQDSLHAYPDVVARLRSGKRPPIVMTATAKDSPIWRNWRDSLSDNWHIERIQYTDTPHVHDEHWRHMMTECSPREWERRGLAMDVGPERMVYSTWDRSKNLQPIPKIGARDVTEEVLARYGDKQRILVGFDPGETVDTSVLLKAYRFANEKTHRWFIVDEVITHGTTQVHIRALLDRLRHRWGCNLVDDNGAPLAYMPVAHVRADPYGDTSNKTDRSVYTQFRDAKIEIRPAAYHLKTAKPGTVPKEAGIEMVCRLFCNVNGDRRLFVATDDHGKPVATKTLESIELSERDLAGKAETEKKGTARDLSHFTAAVRYALWGLEKPRMGQVAV